MQVSTEVVSRLHELLAGEGITLPTDATASRCRPSESDRRNGAWSWALKLRHPVTRTGGHTVSDVGSHWPMRDLVRCAFWEVTYERHGDASIDPCGSCQTAGKR